MVVCGVFWLLLGPLRFSGLFLLAFGSRRPVFLTVKTWMKRGCSCGSYGHFGGGFGNWLQNGAVEKRISPLRRSS
jgi:hypothetical protein